LIDLGYEWTIDFISIKVSFHGFVISFPNNYFFAEPTVLLVPITSRVKAT
jgi:hypothetical protein